MLNVFDEIDTEYELAAYRLKLLALADRFAAGERTSVGGEAQHCADALICLLDEAPLGKREKVDHLMDRYEALRASCLA